MVKCCNSVCSGCKNSLRICLDLGSHISCILSQINFPSLFPINKANVAPRIVTNDLTMPNSVSSTSSSNVDVESEDTTEKCRTNFTAQIEFAFYAKASLSDRVAFQFDRYVCDVSISIRRFIGSSTREHTKLPLFFSSLLSVFSSLFSFLFVNSICWAVFFSFSLSLVICLALV